MRDFEHVHRSSESSEAREVRLQEIRSQQEPVLLKDESNCYLKYKAL